MIYFYDQSVSIYNTFKKISDEMVEIQKYALQARKDPGSFMVI